MRNVDDDFMPHPPFGFTIRLARGVRWHHLATASHYAVALAFVSGAFDVEGDLVAAIEWWRAQTRRPRWERLAAALSRLSPQRWVQPMAVSRRHIRYHYDRSNDFYRQFLDRRLVYSCAYFTEPQQDLDTAQTAKLDHICRKLQLRADERFLDVGCGWGALVAHAAAHFGVQALGCTLSQAQFIHASTMLKDSGLAARAQVQDTDYRHVLGRFDKIASVGMFEHVGRRRLRSYFVQLASLLEDGGLLLNHGITRPEGAVEDTATLFMRRHVFPGGELVRLSDVIHAAGDAGLEVLDVENLRPHYALTCERWVERLQANAQACLSIVGPETWRTWRLYLAASAAAFRAGDLDVCQVLLGKRHSRYPRPLTRNYMYA